MPELSPSPRQKIDNRARCGRACEDLTGFEQILESCRR